MAKVGNEVKLILSLAEERMKARISQLKSLAPSLSETNEARKQGKASGLEEAMREYREVVRELEARR